MLVPFQVTGSNRLVHRRRGAALQRAGKRVEWIGFSKPESCPWVREFCLTDVDQSRAPSPGRTVSFSSPAFMFFCELASRCPRRERLEIFEGLSDSLHGYAPASMRSS